MNEWGGISHSVERQNRYKDNFKTPNAYRTVHEDDDKENVSMNYQDSAFAPPLVEYTTPHVPQTQERKTW